MRAVTTKRSDASECDSLPIIGHGSPGPGSHGDEGGEGQSWSSTVQYSAVQYSTAWALTGTRVGEGQMVATVSSADNITVIH